MREATRTGAAPNVSDAYTINGQPGDLYKCSTKGLIPSFLKFDYIKHVTCVCLLNLLYKTFDIIETGSNHKRETLLGREKTHKMKLLKISMIL